MSAEERLAVVETELKFVRDDLSEVKADVKRLLASQAGGQALSALGKYFIPFLAVAISAAAFLRGG